MLLAPLWLLGLILYTRKTGKGGGREARKGGRQEGKEARKGGREGVNEVNGSWCEVKGEQEEESKELYIDSWKKEKNIYIYMEDNEEEERKGRQKKRMGKKINGSWREK